MTATLEPMSPPDAIPHAASGLLSGVQAPASSAPQGLTITEPATSAGPQSWVERAICFFFRDETWHRRRRRALADLLFLGFAAAAALLLAAAPVRAFPQNRLLVLLYPLVVLSLLHGRRAYDDDRIDASPLDAAIRVIGPISAGSMCLLAMAAVLGPGPHQVGLSVRLWLFSAVYVGGGRAALQWIRREAQIAGVIGTPTLIVGAGMVGHQVARRLLSTPALGLRPVGFLDANPLADTGGPVLTPILGGHGDMEQAITLTGARRVILAFSSAPDRALVSAVRECQRLGVAVSLVPRMYEQVNGRTRLEHVGGLPLLCLDAADPYGWQFAVKHAIDRGLAAAALVLLSPLMLAIALAVRLSSPGSVLFRQCRVGRDGVEFNLLKYRSMRNDAAEPAFVPRQGTAPGGVEGDDRRTAIGRLLRTSSLDELPQLINVLRGDMSLIGPRPERPEFVERFVKDVDGYGDRHRVKAGITGWAQVNGLRGQTSISDRVEWDNYYIRNWSLMLDLKIAALTVAEIFRFRDG